MKTYVITLSQQFPKGHRKHGEPTYFREQFQNTILDDAGVSACDCCKYETRDCEACGYKAVNFRKKIHTIRANYPLWEQRFAEIERGDACLSVRQWTGMPYRSKQVEIGCLTARDGIGIQILSFPGGDISAPITSGRRRKLLNLNDLSRNDGLSYSDWYKWFEKYDRSKPMVIIHFTKFRY